MSFSDQNLIWIDLEMTGLDPEMHKIIEMATIVTDSELNILAEGPVIAIHQPESELAKMDEWCTTTHTASGLVARVRQSQVSEEEAIDQTLAFLKQWCRKANLRFVATVLVKTDVSFTNTCRVWKRTSIIVILMSAPSKS